jgi:hypothetical protein
MECYFSAMKTSSPISEHVAQEELTARPHGIMSYNV